MEGSTISALIIGLIFLILILIFVVNVEKQDWKDSVFFGYIALCCAVVLMMLGFIYGDYCGQKKVLRNKPDYKLEIKYELKDSIYTPVDTTFTEIKH